MSDIPTHQCDGNSEPKEENLVSDIYLLTNVLEMLSLKIRIWCQIYLLTNVLEMAC